MEQRWQDSKSQIVYTEASNQLSNQINSRNFKKATDSYKKKKIEIEKRKDEYKTLSTWYG